MVSDQPAREASTAEPTVVAHENGRLAYTEYGDADGDPVVLFHGTPGSRLLGALFERATENHGIRLLAVDRPGYGNSEPWQSRSITDAGAYTTAVLDDADIETATLLAFSGGCPQAIATAATHGDRVDRVGDFDWRQSVFDPSLTDRQRDAVRAAVREGYYDVPRDGDVEVVADALGCSTSTAAEHLRKAERNLVTEFVGLADHDR